MAATAIRQKLYEYIRVAEDKKVKAIYTMLEEEIEEVQNYWDNKDFVAELDKRSAEYKSDKKQGISWKAAKSEITKSSKRSK